MIPTRQQIAEKILQIKAHNGNVFDEVFVWLDTLDMPKEITIAGEVVNPKQQILNNLNSY